MLVLDPALDMARVSTAVAVHPTHATNDGEHDLHEPHQALLPRRRR